VKESTNPKDKGKVERTRVISLDDSTLKIPGAITPDPGSPVKEVKVVWVFKKVN
jgi:hypothetical protein